MMKFIKLVRSRVVSDSDKVVYSRINNHAEYIAALRNKLREEADEYIDDPCIEELADVYEALLALASDDLGVSWSRVEDVATEKRERKGVFNGRMALYLEGPDR